MNIKRAEFTKSSANFSQLPTPEFPEYAFVGRSNVGKSSWINCLTERKSLAKTSSTPGKTQLINHFLINDAWYLVDLPGYGYAKTSKKKRALFADMIGEYLQNRKTLVNVYVLVDSRIPPQKSDLEFLEFLGVNEIAFTILRTKTDHPTQKEYSKHLKSFKEELFKSWEQFPQIIQTSAVKGRGRDEVLAQIEEWNQDWRTLVGL